MACQCQRLAAVAVLGVALLAAAVERGVLWVPLPHPAASDSARPWPPEAPYLPRALSPSVPVLPLHELAVRLFEGQLANVETVSVDPVSSGLLLPDKHGDVWAAARWPNGSYSLSARPLAQLGPGRVLGSKLDGGGGLLMCDVLKGLLRLDVRAGRLEQLASRVSAASADPGSPVSYCNSLDVAANGSVFFTASTDILPARSRDGSYDTGFAWMLSNFRGLPRGRVLAWHPGARDAHVVARGFAYCDGIAAARDAASGHDYLLVVETDALRVIKLWLSGDSAGQREVLIDALPGLPAGLSKASDGNFWLSMTTPVPPYSRHLGSIALRTAIAWLPRSWRPPIKVWGAVLKISPAGEPLLLLLDPTGARVATASAATEHGGRLFLGSIMGGPFISYVELSDVQRRLQAGAVPTAGSVDWAGLGGYSLHEQRELWGPQAAGRARAAAR